MKMTLSRVVTVVDMRNNGIQDIFLKLGCRDLLMGCIKCLGERNIFQVLC